jgi:hypothetical protein
MKKIDNYFHEILEWANQNIEDHKVCEKYKNLFNNNYNLKKDNLNDEKIDYCIEKFVIAEMDYSTDGKKGIGRFTEDTPRFGGYYRKSLKNLEKEKSDEFAEIMSSLIKKAYVSSILLTDTKEISINDKDSLFKIWIPKIYTFNGMSEGVVDLFLGTLTNEINIFKKKLVDYNMKAPLFSKDNHEKILFGYCMCGVTLWLSETFSK